MESKHCNHTSGNDAQWLLCDDASSQLNDGAIDFASFFSGNSFVGSQDFTSIGTKHTYASSIFQKLTKGTLWEKYNIKRKL